MYCIQVLRFCFNSVWKIKESFLWIIIGKKKRIAKTLVYSHIIFIGCNKDYAKNVFGAYRYVYCGDIN